MHVSCKSGSSNPWISIRSWDPRFDTYELASPFVFAHTNQDRPVLEKGGLLAAIEEGGPVLNWPLADNEIMEAKPMLSTNPRKSTAESLRSGSGPATATGSKVGKNSTHLPSFLRPKTTTSSEGRYSTFGLPRLCYSVADEGSGAIRRRGRSSRSIRYPWLKCNNILTALLQF